MKTKKTYFVVSDVHSFFEPMIKALKENGFVQTNKSHFVVIAGDAFDRGPDTIKMYEWMKKMISQKRLIWVKGNHEELFINLSQKQYPSEADFYNGTVKSFCAFANINDDEINYKKVFTNYLFEKEDKMSIDEIADLAWKDVVKAWNNISNKVNALNINDFINKNTVNYFEIKNYVIVHSFIPLRDLKYNLNWRQDATDQEWQDATWTNPFDRIDDKLFDEEYKNNKILVFGHWFTCLKRWFDAHPDKRWDPYDKENDHSIINSDPRYVALDASTALSNKVNVLIIKE